MVMGWDEAMWNTGGKASTDNMSWSELSGDQKNSATALGYTQDRWDNSIPITVILTLYNALPHYLFFEQVIELLVSKQSVLTKHAGSDGARRWGVIVEPERWVQSRVWSSGWVSFIRVRTLPFGHFSDMIHKVGLARASRLV